MLAGEGILQFGWIDATGGAAPHVFDQFGVFCGTELEGLVQGATGEG